MKDIKNFEELRSYLYDERYHCYEYLVDCLEELNEFQRGREVGYIHALESVMEMLRHQLKYGEDVTS